MDELLNSLRQMNRLLADTSDKDPDRLRDLMVFITATIRRIEDHVEQGISEAEVQEMAARDIREIQRLFVELCNPAEAPWHNN